MSISQQTILSNLNEKQEDLTKHRDTVLEHLRCSTSPLYFLQNYVYIQDKTAQKTVRWEPWPYLVDLLGIFLTEKEIIIGKARQLGITWLVVAYCLWHCLFKQNTNVLLFSKKESDAAKLVGGGEAGDPGKAKFIWSHLPDFLRPKLGRDTQLIIDFPSTSSSMEALPSTEDAGRSTDATIVVRDELDFHPYGEANFAAVGPTIDAGGQSIELSSRDKSRTDSHFMERFNLAMMGENTAFPIFLPHQLRVIRDPNMTLEEWWERTKKKYPAWQLEQEYPTDLKDFLSELKTRKFFDKDALDDMQFDILRPVEKHDFNTHGGIVKFYKLAVPGEKYCVATDPSDGRDDPHASIVINSTGEQVAESHGKTAAEECARIHDELVRIYNNAYNTYELNAFAGGVFAATIDNLDTPRRAMRIDPEGEPVTSGKHLSRHGWWTGSKLKRNQEDALEVGVRLRLLRVRSQECLDEMNGYIVPEGDEPQASRGMHDDYIDAWRMVWQLKKMMPTGDNKLITGRYKINW